MPVGQLMERDLFWGVEVVLLAVCIIPPGLQELCKSQQYPLPGNLCEGCVPPVVVHTNDDHMRKPVLYE